MASDTSYHPCEDLASAISTMERFRNEEGVESLELFQMSPVNFEFKTYYQVEIGDPASSLGTPAGLSAVAPLAEAAPAVEPTAAAPAVEAVEEAPVVEATETAETAVAESIEAPSEPVSPWDIAPESVEVPTAADQSVVPFPTAEPVPVEALAIPPIPPAPAVPAPAEAAEASSMFGEAFESEEDPFLVAQPVEAAAEVPAGSGLGFELSAQADQTSSPFGDAPAAADPFGAGDIPPPPPPPQEGEGILAEMAEMADSKAKEPRRGLFGR